MLLKGPGNLELRTNRLVNETLGGQYHSVFKGQGMNFEEVPVGQAATLWAELQAAYEKAIARR